MNLPFATLLVVLHAYCVVANQYRSVAYYGNWDIYPRNFMPSDLPADKLTHVNYAFANVDPQTGNVFLSDLNADVEKHYPSDGWTAAPNVYGNIKQLFLLKKRNRKLKVLLSVGGWTYAQKMNLAASTESSRQNFSQSAVKILRDCGFDGIDIDWEFPDSAPNATQAYNFVALLSQVRNDLDACKQGYLLTFAASAGPGTYKALNVKDMSSQVDFLNLMGYDYAGATDNLTCHQANLFRSNCSWPDNFNTDDAARYYTSQGIDSSKIVLGMPLYGRAFTHTEGLGKHFNGVGNATGNGSWEIGVWDYKALPQPGAQEITDKSAGASYSYDSSRRVLISYDNPEIARQKAEYIVSKNLGGGMWWESSADKKGEGSLIDAVVKVFPELEQSQNHLDYPDSAYENLRNQFQ